jgi:hypothetical protein
MARELDNLVLELLREIRDTQQDHSRLLIQHSEEFSRLNARSTAVMPGQRAGHPFRRPSNRDAGGMDRRVRPGNDGHCETPES